MSSPTREATVARNSATRCSPARESPWGIKAGFTLGRAINSCSNFSVRVIRIAAELREGRVWGKGFSPFGGCWLLHPMLAEPFYKEWDAVFDSHARVVAQSGSRLGNVGVSNGHIGR